MAEGAGPNFGVVHRERTIMTHGKVSSSVLFACTVPIVFVITFVLSVEPSIRKPSPISWGITELAFLVGSIFTIFLSLSAYRNQEKWLAGVRTEVVSQKPRLIFFWLFGFCCIIYSALNMAINIDCMVKGGNQPFTGEKILSTLSHLIEMVFFASQLGFIGFFANYKFYSSVVLNYGMCMMMITHLIVWFHSCMASFFRHDLVKSPYNFTVINMSDCFWTSDINKLRSSLEPYVHPTQTEYSLLATAFLLKMWRINDFTYSTTDEEKNAFDGDESEIESESTPLIQNSTVQRSTSRLISCSPQNRELPANFRSTTDTSIPVSIPSNTSMSENSVLERVGRNIPHFKYNQQSMPFYITILLGILILTPLVVTILIMISVWEKDMHMWYTWFVVKTYLSCVHVLLLTLAYVGLRKQCHLSSYVYNPFDKAQILILSAAGTIAYQTFSFLAGVLSNSEDQETENVLAFNSFLTIVVIYFQTVLIIHSGRCIKGSEHNSTSSFCNVEYVFLLLLMTNSWYWFFDSFLYGRFQKADIRSKFYSKVYWAVINEVVFPFVIFYRFHSFMDMYERYQQFSKRRSITVL